MSDPLFLRRPSLMTRADLDYAEMRSRQMRALVARRDWARANLPVVSYLPPRTGKRYGADRGPR